MRMFLMVLVGFIGLVLGAAIILTAQTVTAQDNHPEIPPAITNFRETYQKALEEPFIKAGDEITDPKIKDFWSGLISKTGLIKDAK